MYRKVGLISVAALTLGTGWSLAGGIGHDSHAASPPTAMGQRAPASRPTASRPARLYVCPMHQDISSDAPGKCPKCGMNLELKKGRDQPKQGQTPHEGDHNGHSH